jgi:hypothetical protein
MPLTVCLIFLFSSSSQQARPKSANQTAEKKSFGSQQVRPKSAKKTAKTKAVVASK